MNEKKYSFTIVIPAYNESKYISGCLNSILNQNYDLNKIEIIVVDGMSEDSTDSIVTQFTKKYKNIFLVKNPHRKTPVSLNIGVKSAHNEVIVILGAHTEIDNYFLHFNNKYLSDENIFVVGGTQINNGRTFIQKCIGLTMESPFAMASAAYRWSRKKRFVDTVVYAAYKKEIFEKVGLFEENLLISEDAEFNWRVRQAGFKIFFTPEIKTYYFARSSLFSFFKQIFRYGILRVNVQKKHYNSIKIRHLISPVFFLTITTLTTLSFFQIIGISALFWLLTFYFSINILFTAFFLFPRKIPYLPIVTIFTFIIHLLWGSGYSLGIFLPNKESH